MSSEHPHRVFQHWSGTAALSGGKAYAACEIGAMHYRSLGDIGHSRTPVLLLHQTPFGIAEWVDIQPLLANTGRRVVAADTPGYGMSDSPRLDVTIAELADNLSGLLDHLGIASLIVAGHHTGAAIAAAFAARHPDRTAAVVLHGCPVYSETERQERSKSAGWSYTPQTDGSHLAEMFRTIHAFAGKQPAALTASTWATLGAYLAGQNPPAYRAVFANDMLADVALIRAPTLILTDRDDSLHVKDLAVAKRRNDFILQELSDGGSFSLMLQPERWVESVSQFFDDAGV